METRTSLLRDVRDGRNWAEFVTLYEPLLLSYVRSRGLREDTARDVVQDIFISLVRHMPKFELDKARGRFRTWLYQVARNAVIDRVRQQDRRDEAREGYEAVCHARETSEEADEREFETAHRQRVLERVLERVRPQVQARTWTCFEQHVLRNRPSAEVGAELNLTPNSVYVNASRVLAKVRALCAEYLEELGDE